MPGLDIVSMAASAADDLKLAADIGADLADTDAAVEFAEYAPYDIEQLRKPGPDQSFSSFDAFKKINVEKVYGTAKPGCRYHHLAEQAGAKAGVDESDMHSTDNIVEIPTRVHEDVNSAYEQKGTYEGKKISLRDYLKGKPFSVRRAYGKKLLQDLGVIR